MQIQRIKWDYAHPCPYLQALRVKASFLASRSCSPAFQDPAKDSRLLLRQVYSREAHQPWKRFKALGLRPGSGHRSQALLTGSSEAGTSRLPAPASTFSWNSPGKRSLPGTSNYSSSAVILGSVHLSTHPRRGACRAAQEPGKSPGRAPCLTEQSAPSSRTQLADSKRSLAEHHRHPQVPAQETPCFKLGCQQILKCTAHRRAEEQYTSASLIIVTENQVTFLTILLGFFHWLVTTGLTSSN